MLFSLNTHVISVILYKKPYGRKQRMIQLLLDQIPDVYVLSNIYLSIFLIIMLSFSYRYFVEPSYYQKNQRVLVDTLHNKIPFDFRISRLHFRTEFLLIRIRTRNRLDDEDSICTLNVH